MDLRKEIYLLKNGKVISGPYFAEEITNDLGYITGYDTTKLDKMVDDLNDGDPWFINGHRMEQYYLSNK